jgi:glycosyltransferase involved in cell wall biosynthesis
MHHPEWFSKSFANVYRFLIPRIVKRSQKVFTVSETIRDQISETFGIAKNEIGLLYNGLPYELKHYKAANNPKCNIILTVSSINPRKNLSFLIDAFLESGLTDHELVIVGAQNNVFAQEHIPVNSRISFTGYLSNPDLYELYHQATLFVSLSLDEGFGIPVLEALSCGCPVLISDIAVYKECFSEVATFTSATDKPLAAKAILQAIQHPPITLGIGALLLKYNYEVSASALINLLRETAKKM